MRPARSVECAAALVITFGSVNPLSGQRLYRPAPDVGTVSMSGGLWIDADPIIRPAGVGFQEESGRKSTFLAGFLSLYVPGAGSFYAGNKGHGYRHLLVVPAASVSLFLIGVGMGEAGVVPGYLGFAALLANWPWSVVTAVRDANEHNRPAASTGAAAQLFDHVYVEPRLRLLRGDSGFGGGTRVELRLVRVRF